MSEIIIYPFGEGYAYFVEVGDTRVYQEWNPFRIGRVYMTEEEARYFAQCIVDGVEPDYPVETIPEQPTPEPPLTPEQKEIAELKHRLSLIEPVIDELILGGGA